MLIFLNYNTYIRKRRGRSMNLGIETEVLEFKKSTGEIKEAIYSIGAILNKHGHGELYFGVKPDGTVIGQQVSEETLRHVSHRIAEGIKPRIYPEINKVILDGKECIHVKFEGEQVPYFALDVAKMRVADEDVTMSPEQIATLILNSGREGTRWEGLVSNKTVEDVDEELLKSFTSKVRVSTDKVRVNEKQLNASQIKILDYLQMYDRITNKEVCDLLDIKDSRAYKILKGMNEEGIIKKEGSYRDSYYRIAEDTNSYHI